MTEENLFAKTRLIKAFLFDFDGVLTDGNMILLEDGQWLRQMHIRDCLGISRAVAAHYKLGVVTGSDSEAITIRLNSLGVEDVFLQTEDKNIAFDKFLLTYGLYPNQVAYIGDDVNDLAVLKICGLSVCPSDADSSVRNVCDYITESSGGKGCAREIIELIMKSQDLWKM